MKTYVAVIVAALALLLTCMAQQATAQGDGLELRRAAYGGDLPKVKQLLTKGVDVDAKSDDEATPLLGASQNGHTAIVKLLLGSGADVNAKARDGSSALLLSSMNGHTDVVQALLDKGADVNIEARGRFTPLMMASQKGHTKVAELLLNKGANVNAKLNNGGTALILASQNGHIDVVKLLLEKRADVRASGDFGTAETVASKKGYTDIVQLLKQSRGSMRGNRPGGNAMAQPDASSRTATQVTEASLDKSVKWIQQMQQPFPEDAFGFGENGLVQASDKPVPFEVAKVGRYKNNQTVVLLVLSLKLKSTGKTAAGEFEFSMTEWDRQQNLVSERTPSGSIVLYRQPNERLSDWQRKMVAGLLRASGSAITQEDADFLNALK